MKTAGKLLTKKLSLKQWALLLAGLIFLLWYAFCLPRPLFDAPLSVVLEDRNGQLLSARIAAAMPHARRQSQIQMHFSAARILLRFAPLSSSPQPRPLLLRQRCPLPRPIVWTSPATAWVPV